MQEDKARLERKINKYMSYGSGKQEPASQSATIATEKIRSLHQYLHQIESESNMSESDFENSYQSFSKPATNKKKYEDQDPIQKISIKKDTKLRNQDDEKIGELRGKCAELESVCMDLENKCAQQGGELSVNRIELSEANKTIETLKDMLEKEQQRAQEKEIKLRGDYEKRVSEEKEDTATTIERQLDFIDKLVKDKEELNSQIESLSLELKGIQEKQEGVIIFLKDKHLKELKANKEAWLAAEKQRKEKWMSEKTSEIKEFTIKGLEPEIERLINKHKVEINKLKDSQGKEIADLKDKMQEEYETKFRAYKEKSVHETEDLVAKERAFRVDRNQQEITRVEQIAKEEKDRLRKQLESEIRQVEQRRREDNDSYLQQIKNIKEDHIEEITRMKTNQQSAVEQQIKESKLQLEITREQMKLEQEQWSENFKQKLNEEVQKRTAEIKRKLEKERDYQIEVVINKVTEENADMEKKIGAKFESRIDQINLSHREEIKQLKKDLSYYEDLNAKTSVSKNQIQENVQTLSKRLVEVQENLSKEQSENKQLQVQIKEIGNELQSQKNLVKLHEENVKKEMELELQKLRNQILVLNKTLSQMGAEHQLEMESAENKHSKSLEEVEERVKNIVMKKDQQIGRLKEEVKLKEATCLKMEQLLDKQRRDLVQKKSN